MRVKHLIILMALLFAPISAAAPAQAGGVVTVYDEAHLLAALAGGGTVTFACSGTITLTNTITIAADTTIDGSGQAVTISGHDAVRVLSVNPEVALNLNELTVANGSADIGGGLFNDGGAVTVSNTTLSGNNAGSKGGGIYSRGADGMVIVNNSTFLGNNARAAGYDDDVGGGIFNDRSSMLIVDRSAFSGNMG
jgi:hypothetical protein